MTSTFKYPAISNEGGLSVYLDQIKKFPMLDAEEEYMLAKNWKNTGNVKSAEYDAINSTFADSEHIRLARIAAMTATFTSSTAPRRSGYIDIRFELE